MRGRRATAASTSSDDDGGHGSACAASCARVAAAPSRGRGDVSHRFSWRCRGGSGAQHARRCGHRGSRSGASRPPVSPAHDAVERGEQRRIELRPASSAAAAPAEVGAGRDQRPAERRAQRDHHRMRADPHRDAVVRAGDPVRHAAGGGHDPGVRAGPAGEHGFAAIGRQRVPVEQAVELVERAGDQDQALVDRALLEREQAQRPRLRRTDRSPGPRRLRWDRR